MCVQSILRSVCRGAYIPVFSTFFPLLCVLIDAYIYIAARSLRTLCLFSTVVCTKLLTVSKSDLFTICSDLVAVPKVHLSCFVPLSFTCLSLLPLAYTSKGYSATFTDITRKTSTGYSFKSIS